ncbi:hypothetical protein BDZ89DRAFT_1225178 [Hymenopellis radicata]|nr:hypothetical protein BDZ89DRAFT_1225178 [Hymenopellis radicata]
MGSHSPAVGQGRQRIPAPRGHLRDVQERREKDLWAHGGGDAHAAPRIRPGSPKTYFALADANSLQQRKFAARALLETGVKESISVLKSTTSTGRWCKANFRQFYDGDARLFGHLYSCVAAATCDGIYASIVGECAWDEDGWSMIQQNCVDFYYSTLPSINSTEWPADVSDIVTNYWSPRVDSRQQ